MGPQLHPTIINMKMRRPSVSILFLGLLLTGCYTARVTSVKAPVHGQYSRVLLMSGFDDVELLDYYESAYQDAFLSMGVVSIRGLDLFPPLRTYSDSEVTAKMTASKIDAVLSLVPSGTANGTTTSYNAFTDSYHTHQTVDAVYSEVWLKDIESKQMVYRASISTAITDENSLYYAAKKMVRDLAKDGFLLPTVKPKHNSPNPNEN